MTPDELDLARARDLVTAQYDTSPDAAEKRWQAMSAHQQAVLLGFARAIREGDEKRGLVVVPREAT